MDHLDPRAAAWVAQAWGREPVAARRLLGGWTSTVLRVGAADGAEAVLRLMTREPWRRHAPDLLAREARTMDLLEAGRVPAPRSIAVDPDGSVAGVPAHLVTLLPGSLELQRCDDDLLVRLAALLDAVHAVEPLERPREYQSWAPPAKCVVPPWARRPEVWRAAFTLLDQPPPSYDGVLLHRDLHLGNVLWSAGEVTGLVDWVETSWGPADLDVAHSSTYLALLHGPRAADRFEELAGRPGTYWAVLDLVGVLPDPAKLTRPWHDQGLDVPDDRVRTRLEDRLAEVLGR